MTSGQFHLLKILRWHIHVLIEGDDDQWNDDSPIDLERIDILADNILIHTRRWSDPDSDPGETSALFDALSLAGRVKMINSDIREAEKFYREGLELSLKTKFKINPLDLAELKQNLGACLDQQGREIESIVYLTDALELMERADPVPLESVANLSNNLGLSFRNQKKFEEAEEHYLRALEVFSKLGDNELELALVCNNLGTLYWTVDELDAAKENHEIALEIRTRLLPRKSLDIGQSASNLAVVLHQGNQISEAEELYKKAIKIINDSITEDPSLYDAVTKNYAALLDSKSEGRGAAKLLETARQQLENVGCGFSRKD